MPPRPPRDRPLPFQPSRGLGLRFLPRVFLDPLPSIGFLASQRLHSVLLAKLWLLQLGQVQSPGFIFESLKPPELLDRWPREFLPPPPPLGRPLCSFPRLPPERLSLPRLNFLSPDLLSCRPRLTLPRGAISTGEPIALTASMLSFRGCTWTSGPSIGPNTVSTLPSVFPPVIRIPAPSFGARPSKEIRRPPSCDSLDTVPEKLMAQPRRLPYMRATTAAATTEGRPAAGSRPPSSPSS